MSLGECWHLSFFPRRGKEAPTFPTFLARQHSPLNRRRRLRICFAEEGAVRPAVRSLKKRFSTRIVRIKFAGMLPKDQLRPLVDASAIRKETRARKLVDAARYITCLRFLVHQLSQESLALNQYIAKSVIFKDFPNLGTSWNKYFWAVRRSLKTDKQTIAAIPGVAAEEACWKLEKGWIRFLFHFSGLALAHQSEMRAFLRLNPYLCIDAATRSFAEAHPGVLERVRMSLRGSPPVSKRSRKRSPDTPVAPPENDLASTLPAKASETEHILDMMKAPGHSPHAQQPGHHIQGRMTRADFDKQPTESIKVSTRSRIAALQSPPRGRRRRHKTGHTKLSRGS